jgi:hypothetical protein
MKRYLGEGRLSIKSSNVSAEGGGAFLFRASSTVSCELHSTKLSIAMAIIAIASVIENMMEICRFLYGFTFMFPYNHRADHN